jgi:hypothetical protein
MVTVEERYRRIRRKYGLTAEQWNKLWDSQHGRCFICRKLFSSTRLACVDHEHEEGLIRGLLCTNCNYDLGLHHDNIEWFQRAAVYLAAPIAVDVLGTLYVPGSIGEERVRRYGRV